MKIPQHFTLIVAAAGLALMTGCLGGGDGDGEGADGGIIGGCDSSVDCGEDEFCHPYAKECVANCVTQTDSCTGETPVCNEDNGGTRPLDDSRFNNVCICSDTSCGDGQICHPEYGVCVDACTTDDGCNDFDGDSQACYLFEDSGDAYCQSECAADSDCPTSAPNCDVASGQCLGGCNSDDAIKIECGADEACNAATGQCGDAGCTAAGDCAANENCDVLSGECFALCSTVGATDDANCLVDEMCVFDGTCADPCDDELCLMNNQLCLSDTTVADFNNCVAPDDETGTCVAAVEFEFARDENGPVIFQAAYYREEELDSECETIAGTTAYVVDFFYQDPDGDAFTTNGTAFESFFVVEAGGSPQKSSSFIVFGDGATASAGDAGMTMCFSSAPTEIAVQIGDEAGNVSNAACATLAP